MPGGLAAWPIPSRWNVWTSGSVNGLDRSGAANSGGFGGRTDVSLDYRVLRTTIVGAFLGYQGEHLDADFTGGTVDENAFEALKLPTFLREYDKVARQCVAEVVDHVRFLLRLVELEVIDRERRMIERRRPQEPRSMNGLSAGNWAWHADGGA